MLRLKSSSSEFAEPHDRGSWESATIRPLTSRAPTKGEYLWLAIIVVVGAALRLYRLTAESLWTDEAFSALAASQPSVGAMLDFIKTDVHPPGFPFVLWTWGKLVGASDFTFRLFTDIGGLLMVPIMFRLGRQLYDPSTGLIAAFLAAVSIQGIYFSQEVRAYSWMATLSALSVSLALECLRRDARGSLALLVLTTSALASFHYFGLMFAGLLWAWIVIAKIRARGSVRWLAAGASVVFASAIPWIFMALNSVGRSNWIPKSDLKFVAELVNVYYGPGLWLDIIATVLVTAGLILAAMRRGKQNMGPELGLIAWILIPLAIALAVSWLARPIYSPRNMLIGAGAAILLLASSIMAIAGKAKTAWVIAFATTLLSYGLHLRFGNGFMVVPIKQQVREAAQFIDLHNTDGLPIYSLDWDEDNFIYYFIGTDEARRLSRIPEASVRSRRLSSVVPDPEFWIASAGIDINAVEDLTRDFEIVEKGEFLLARAYRLKRRNPVN